MSNKEDSWALMFWKPAGNAKSPSLKELKKEQQGNSPAKKKFLTLVELVEDLGPELILPYNRRLGPNLYELRDVGNGKRYYYKETDFLLIEEGSEKRIILLLLVAGDKGSQDGDIKLSEERAKQSMEKDNILNEENLEIVRKNTYES